MQFSYSYQCCQAWGFVGIMGFFVGEVLGFQASLPQKLISRSRPGNRHDGFQLKSSSVEYSNRTEYSFWGFNMNKTVDIDSVGEIEKLTPIPYEEKQEYSSFDASNDWVADSFEDNTEHDSELPTLETLRSWTQEYLVAVDLAGGMTRVSVGVGHMLSDAFVFTSPHIGPLNKEDYIKLMDYYRLSGLDLASAIPDLTVTYDGWHIDPHDPYRIWAVARYSGTHIGTAVVPGTSLQLNPPNKGDHPVRFVSGPEMQSFLWTPDKEILWQTMGYVGCDYTGSNRGHGGLDGLLISMGLPSMYVDAVSPVRKLKAWFAQFQSDQGEDAANSKTRYGRLPEWWNERKYYDLNVHK